MSTYNVTVVFKTLGHSKKHTNKKSLWTHIQGGRDHKHYLQDCYSTMLKMSRESKLPMLIVGMGRNFKWGYQGGPNRAEYYLRNDLKVLMVQDMWQMNKSTSVSAAKWDQSAGILFIVSHSPYGRKLHKDTCFISLVHSYILSH